MIRVMKKLALYCFLSYSVVILLDFVICCCHPSLSALSVIRELLVVINELHFTAILIKLVPSVSSLRTTHIFSVLFLCTFPRLYNVILSG